jgi:hypothetical protein
MYYSQPNIKKQVYNVTCDLRLSSSSAEQPMIFSASSLKVDIKASPLASVTFTTMIYLEGAN